MAKKVRPQKGQEREVAAALPPAGETPLVILLGLPRAVANSAPDFVNHAMERCAAVQTIVAPDADGNLYPRKQLRQILASVTGFTRRKQSDERQPSPSEISLLYVPAATDHFVLEALDFCVFPVPLPTLAEFNEVGKQMRHDRDAVREALVSALAPGQPARVAFHLVKERIKRVTDAEGLQLPPVNFKLDQHRTLGALFLEMRNGTRDWRDRFPELVAEEFGKEHIEHLGFFERRRAFKDRRGLIFLRAHPKAFHAYTREVQLGDSIPDSLSVLRSAYRFGVALDRGFHHDVQVENGAELRTKRLDCSRDGPVTVDDDYCNIYPNDYIRGKNKAAAVQNSQK